jgi:hypothetical protein
MSVCRNVISVMSGRASGWNFALRAGLRTRDGVQIIDGLKAGEELITTGILQLRDGMKVRVRLSADAALAR